MKKATARASEEVRVQQIDDFVNASLLLDEWLDWMTYLSGQPWISGSHKVQLLRSRRLT